MSEIVSLISGGIEEGTGMIKNIIAPSMPKPPPTPGLSQANVQDAQITVAEGQAKATEAQIKVYEAQVKGFEKAKP